MVGPRTPDPLSPSSPPSSPQLRRLQGGQRGGPLPPSTPMHCRQRHPCSLRCLGQADVHHLLVIEGGGGASGRSGLCAACRLGRARAPPTRLPWPWPHARPPAAPPAAALADNHLQRSATDPLSARGAAGAWDSGRGLCTHTHTQTLFVCVCVCVHARATHATSYASGLVLYLP